MIKGLFWASTAAFLSIAGAAELKFSLDGESRKVPGVTYFAGGIRQVPGRFGKGLLIERRTVNSFAPSEVILSDGAKLSGRINRLTLPAGGYAALPLPAIRPKVANTLSFRYRGEGTVSVTFGGRTVASFKAGKEFQNAEAVIIPQEDTGTLRIRAEKAVELTHVMFDKGIGFANTYHAPGKMRTVDTISVKPELFDEKSGAVSCWIKAPWLKKDAKHATAIALFDTKYVPRGRAIFYLCFWSNGCAFITKSKAPKNASCGFKLNELPANKSDWYHFVFNWKLEKDFMNISIIVNGEKVFKQRGFSKGLQPMKTFTIGYVNGAYLNGVLDDFGLFNAPLTQAEAKKIYSAGKPLSQLYKK